MKRVTLILRGCIQNSQEDGSDDKHMVSRVLFNLEMDGQKYENLHVLIKQPVGGNYESDPIEVYPPEGYHGPSNYEAFRDAVERYYRSVVGSTASGIRIPDGSGVRMQNNSFVKEETVQFEVNEEVDEGNTAW